MHEPCGGCEDDSSRTWAGNGVPVPEGEGAGGHPTSHVTLSARATSRSSRSVLHRYFPDHHPRHSLASPPHARDAEGSTRATVRTRTRSATTTTWSRLEEGRVAPQSPCLVPPTSDSLLLHLPAPAPGGSDPAHPCPLRGQVPCLLHSFPALPGVPLPIASLTCPAGHPLNLSNSRSLDVEKASAITTITPAIAPGLGSSLSLASIATLVGQGSEDDEDSCFSEGDALLPKPGPHPHAHPHARCTVLQSAFNAVNILMGIGMLSLPLALSLTGWVMGVGLLLLSALVTMYTAFLLARCLDFEPPPGWRLEPRSLLRHTPARTFGDIGELAFGRAGRTVINTLFMLELGAACVALVILAADSLVALCPVLVEYATPTKLVLVLGVMLPSTLPTSLRFASYGSLLGILSLAFVLVAMVFQGLTKHSATGSLLYPAATRIWPADWSRLPLTFGLIMAGFSGHSVFPSIYRDMRTPRAYGTMVTCSYTFTFSFYLLFACIGYAMFGEALMPEITQNLSLMPSFAWLAQVTLVMVILSLLTKYPLSTFPISIFVAPSSESKLAAWVSCRRGSALGQARAEEPMLHGDDANAPTQGTPHQPHHDPVTHLFSRLLVSGSILLMAIAIPEFHHVMALLGSFCSFSVSVLFPTLCYMRLYGGQEGWSVGPWLGHGLLVVVALVLGLWGTWAAIWAALG